MIKSSPEPMAEEGGQPLYQAPLVEHLRELRQRVMVSLSFVFLGFVIAYTFKEQLFAFLLVPLQQATSAPLVFTAVHELFFAYVKLSLLCGVFFALPIALSQMWGFVAPGLYAHERRLAMPFLVIAPFLFYCGGVFAYYVVMPLAIEFFFAFANVHIMPLPSVKEYLTFFIKMSFGFGLAFELPVFLLLLGLAGLVNTKKLRYFRRYAWVLLFIVAAVLTPPDPLSQVLLALPMVLLYEVAILLLHFLKKKN